MRWNGVILGRGHVARRLIGGGEREDGDVRFGVSISLGSGDAGAEVCDGVGVPCRAVLPFLVVTLFSMVDIAQNGR